MTKIKLIGIGILIFAIGAAIGRFAGPAKAQEKTTEVEREETDRQTNTTIIESPDGTKKTIIELIENTRKEREKETVKITENKPNVSAFAGTGYNFDAGRQTYIGGIEFRVISDIKVSVYGTTSKEAGVFLTIPIR